MVPQPHTNCFYCKQAVANEEDIVEMHKGRIAHGRCVSANQSPLTADRARFLADIADRAELILGRPVAITEISVWLLGHGDILWETPQELAEMFCHWDSEWTTAVRLNATTWRFWLRLQGESPIDVTVIE